MAHDIAIRDIVKTYFGVPVVKGVSFDVPSGTVVGLVGENGAGKSTLVSMLGGLVQPDQGTIEVAGKAYAPRSPREAAAAGISLIHQELNLFSNLTVADNVFVPNYPRRRLRMGVDRRRMEREAKVLLQRVGLDVDPATPVERLAPGERQLVEIARALGTDANIIIFDEPTTSLTARETARLFEVIGQLRDAGKTIVYISHILEDVLQLTERVVVMRDGALVADALTSELDMGSLMAAIVGRELDSLFGSRDVEPSDTVVLAVEAVTQPGVVADVSFSVHASEIVGIFGLMGSGRTELLRILFGLDGHKSGQVLLDGKPLGRDVSARIASGMALITEDRREEGLFMDLPVRDNLAMAALGRWRRAGFINDRGIDAETRKVSDSLRMRFQSLKRQAVKTLSGGNQQKAVIGRWLLSNPRLILLDEPTRGIDVGAKREVYEIMTDLADRGAGLVVVSSEAEELLGICDRILVMRRGELVAEFPRESVTRSAMINAAFGVAQPAVGSTV